MDDDRIQETSAANAIQEVPQYRLPNMTRKDKVAFFADREIKHCRSEGATISNEAVTFILRQWDVPLNKKRGNVKRKTNLYSACNGTHLI